MFKFTIQLQYATITQLFRYYMDGKQYVRDLELSGNKAVSYVVDKV